MLTDAVRSGNAFVFCLPFLLLFFICFIYFFLPKNIFLYSIYQHKEKTSFSSCFCFIKVALFSLKRNAISLGSFRWSLNVCIKWRSTTITKRSSNSNPMAFMLCWDYNKLFISHAVDRNIFMFMLLLRLLLLSFSFRAELRDSSRQAVGHSAGDNEQNCFQNKKQFP